MEIRQYMRIRKGGLTEFRKAMKSIVSIEQISNYDSCIDLRVELLDSINFLIKAAKTHCIPIEFTEVAEYPNKLNIIQFQFLNYYSYDGTQCNSVGYDGVSFNLECVDDVVVSGLPPSRWENQKANIKLYKTKQLLKGD